MGIVDNTIYKPNSDETVCNVAQTVIDLHGEITKKSEIENLNLYKNPQKISAKAPAKLILSGEHAVVYGHPSIAIAIDMYATSTVSKVVKGNKPGLLGFDFANLKYNAKHTINTLDKLKNKAYQDYQRFLHGECSIREVISKPFELLQFAISHFFDKLNVVLPGGIDIKTSSTIPFGCGMGSSAATIMSLLYAVGNLLNLNLSKAKYIELGRDAENLQHGKSSGLDLHLTVEGGCIKYSEGVFKPLCTINKIDTSAMYLINTGTPSVTTGQCVSGVRKHFINGSQLGCDFANLTVKLEKELLTNNLAEILVIIKENHKLLNYIGVVPEKVNTFITSLEFHGCAAKVCGAGATDGNNAGAVLVLCPDFNSINYLKSLCQYNGYSIQALNIDSHGIRIL